MKKMMTPCDLQEKTVIQDVSGTYDWKSQVYKFDACKWGTTNRTSIGTISGVCNLSDDSTTDSFSD